MCVPLTSRHLLCMYVCLVLRLCYPERIVLCVRVYSATHYMVPGIRGCVCHLLRGTCSVCTLAKSYGCFALVYERFIPCVPVCCATQNVSYYVYRYAVLLRTCRTMCTGVLCYQVHSTRDSPVYVPLTSRHLLCVYVSRVLRLCCPCA